MATTLVIVGLGAWAFLNGPHAPGTRTLLPLEVRPSPAGPS